MPRLEPPRAGLTKTGNAKSSIATCLSLLVTTIPSATFMPAAAKIGLAKDLSIATAEAKTPLPT